MTARVCMLVQNPCTNDARVEKEAATLAAAGHDVLVLAVARDGLPREESRGGYTIRRLPVTTAWRGTEATHHLAPSRLDRLLLVPRKAALWLEHAARACAPVRAHLGDGPPGSARIVHAHDLNTLIAGTVATRCARARLVYDSHELNTATSYVARMARGPRRLLSFTEGALARRSDATITVSDSFADLLATKYRIRRPVVVRNCPEPAPPPPRTDVLRDQLGISSGRRIAVYHGSLAPRRGVEELIAAARFIDGVDVVFLGDGSYAAEIPRLAALNDVEDHVHVAPAVPLSDLSRFLASADIGVIPIPGTVPSHRYTLPNKFFECLMAGLPVVSSPLPEVERIVLRDAVGRTADPRDPQAFAKAITSVLADPDYEALRLRCRAMAVERHAWRLETTKLLRLYDSLSANGAM